MCEGLRYNTRTARRFSVDDRDPWALHAVQVFPPFLGTCSCESNMTLEDIVSLLHIAWCGE